MKIAVGISGGVDSALSALLLKEAGHDVFGIFMKNWDEELYPEGECTAESDFDDVRSVCDDLDIPYYSVNFSKEYWDRVFEYFLYEYSRGRTPNPDVLCNKEIKFAAFKDLAMKTGADAMATGHYCRTDMKDGHARLLKGADPGKDQSYFLSMLTEEQLEKAVFPIGGLLKSEVRDIARKRGLAVAEKKDSTGICFIGERNFRKFLKQFLPAKPGEMRSVDGELIGTHEGLMYYTIGQRRGLGIGGRGNGGRWFVVKKDLENNVLIVAQDDNTPGLWSKALETEKFNFINPVDNDEFDCTAKFRYRQPDRPVHVKVTDGGICRIEFKERERAVTEGQFAVLYDGDVCLGGGVIDRVFI